MKLKTRMIIAALAGAGLALPAFAQEPARLGADCKQATVAVAKSSNQDIADKIAQQIRQDPELRQYAIDIHVKDGVVELKGNVGDARQRQAAQKVAMSMPGVVKVVDRMSTKPILQVAATQETPSLPSALPTQTPLNIPSNPIIQPMPSGQPMPIQSGVGVAVPGEPYGIQPGMGGGMAPQEMGTPPLPSYAWNGFVSKWLIYLGLLRSGLALSGDGLAALLACGLLALVGGLAAAAFVRLAGIALLGSPRSDSAARAHESSAWMVGPIIILVAACLGAATVPQLLLPVLQAPVEGILGQDAGPPLIDLEAAVAPIYMIGNLNAWILAALCIGMVGLFGWTRWLGVQRSATWGCGYQHVTTRMQYTASSFAEMTSEQLLLRPFRPKVSQDAPKGLFPSPARFASSCDDPFTERIYQPFFRRWADRLVRICSSQAGNLHINLIYIALAVVLALAWGAIRAWWNEA